MTRTESVPTSHDAPDGLLTVAAVADRCDVTPRTVRRWITAGRLAATRDGQRFLVRPDDVPADGTSAAGLSRPHPPAETSDLVALVARLHDENRQISGQLGFVQAQLQERDNQIKLLQPPPDDETPQRRWWSFRGRIWRWGR